MFSLSQPNIQKPTVYEKDDTAKQLHQIDQNLTVDMMINSVKSGIQAVNMKPCSYYAKSYIGAAKQGETLAALNSCLLDSGWSSYDVRGGGLFCISPDKKHAITVATGTNKTGNVDGYPILRFKKGKTWEHAVNKELPNMSSTTLWILFIFPHQDGVQLELSSIAKFSKGRIEALGKRIILPEILFNDVKIKDKQQVEVAEVVVKRKQKKA